MNQIENRYFRCVAGSLEGVQVYAMNGRLFNYNRTFFVEIARILKKESEMRRKVILERESQMKKLQNLLGNTKQKKTWELCERIDRKQ